MSNISKIVEIKLRSFELLKQERDRIQKSLEVTQGQMDAILVEQDLIARSMLVLQQAKPLLSASSIKQCEELANSAISSVFGFNYTVHWDAEAKRFLLNKDGFEVDLSEDCGGGLVTVVSFVFTVYLLVKLGRRRFLCFDEAFTQVSADYLPSFIEFVKTLCADLEIDILLISHDARIDIGDADTAYRIEDGAAIKLK